MNRNAGAGAGAGGATKRQREKTWAIPSVGSVDRAGNVTFPEVSNLELARLRKLLEDDDEFDAFCSENVAGVKMLHMALRDLVKNNDVVARKNLGHEEDIRSLQEDVVGLRELLQEKQAGYAKLVERQDALARKMSPDELVRKVEGAADEIDMESMELADEFVQDDFDGSLKDWAKQFLRARTLYHKRKAMIAKFQQQQQQQQSVR